MQVWEASKFALQDFPQPPWLVPGLVPGYGITMLYAFPKIGKSIMSIQLAHAIGTGTAFLQYKPLRSWKVLYIQSDLPEAEWAHQIKNLGVSLVSGLHYADGWSTVWMEPGLTRSPAKIKELGDKIKEGGFEFVMYDSLLTISGYANLDEEQTIGHQLTMLRNVTKVPSWLIHHKRKGTPGVPDHSSVSAAGSYALSAGVSTLFDLADNGVKVRGRFVSHVLDLKRGQQGIWLPKSKQDLYKLGN